MKEKVIKAFMGVYVSVCIFYGGVRVAYLAAAVGSKTETETIQEETVSYIAETSAVPTYAPETAASAPPDPVTEQTAGTAAPASELQTTQPEAGTDAPETTAPETTAPQTTQPPTTAAPVTAEPATAQPATAEPTTEETTIAETAPQAPSLEEYLRNLHCGGCGRNCLLCSPHCQTGRRKAQSAESAYYETYGNT